MILPVIQILVFQLYIYAARAPITNVEVTVKRAQDSMNMVEIVLYNLLIPARVPVAVRTFLACRMSRMTIIRVRRTLSETEIERCTTPNLENPRTEKASSALYWKHSVTIPIPTLIGLVRSIEVGV